MERAAFSPLWLVVWHGAERARQPSGAGVQVRGGGRQLLDAAADATGLEPACCAAWPTQLTVIRCTPGVSPRRQYPRTSVWHRVKAPIKAGQEALLNGDFSFG